MRLDPLLSEMAAQCHEHSCLKQRDAIFQEHPDTRYSSAALLYAQLEAETAQSQILLGLKRIDTGEEELPDISCQVAKLLETIESDKHVPELVLRH